MLNSTFTFPVNPVIKIGDDINEEADEVEQHEQGLQQQAPKDEPMPLTSLLQVWARKSVTVSRWWQW